MTIKLNLLSLKSKLRDCEKQFHREPNSVKLLAVTKGQSCENMAQAIAAGQTCFGENYLQEALTKITFFTKESIEWHFIGQIQRNKTKKIAQHFSWVHSVTSEIIAQRLNAERPSSLPPLNICLEININDQLSKTGVALDKLFALAQFCSAQPRLKLRGLMAIPEPKKNFNEQREAFHQLKLLFDQLREKNFLVDTLSMGMSEDWEAAVAEGSTIIRIGRALFGERAV